VSCVWTLLIQPVLFFLGFAQGSHVVSCFSVLFSLSCVSFSWKFASLHVYLMKSPSSLFPVCYIFLMPKPCVHRFFVCPPSFSIVALSAADGKWLSVSFMSSSLTSLAI